MNTIDKPCDVAGEYTEAGRQFAAFSREFYGKFAENADVLELSRFANDSLADLPGIFPLLPASIEVNNIVNNFAPTLPYKLRKTDSVSYTLTAKTRQIGPNSREFVMKTANSISIDKTGNAIIAAIAESISAGFAAMGPDARLTAIRFSIAEVLDAAGVKAILNVCGYDLDNPLRVIPNTRRIHRTLIMGEHDIHGKMHPGDSLYLDIYGTDLVEDTTTVAQPAFTILRRTKTRPVQRIRKSQHKFLRFIENTFGNSYFPIYQLREKYNVWAADKKDSAIFKKIKPHILKSMLKMGLVEGVTGEYIANKMEDNWNSAYHIGRTVYISEGGARLIC